MRARVLSVLALTLVASTSPALSWTAANRVVMIDDAIKMMPPSLRQVLETRRVDVLRGMLEPLTKEDSLPHHPPSEGGTVDASVDASARHIVSGVASQVSFREVARRFGVLAHYVADAGFPPGAAGASGARRYSHFGAFCESRRSRFPFVFYGHDNRALSTGDFKSFTRSILERARAEDAILERAYARAGANTDAAEFDDRSIPFAIASLSYSHSVTDIVQAWLAAWRECHGDFGGTPYLGAPR